MKATAALTLIIGFGALLLFGSLTTTHSWGDDFAGYIMQARGIVTGKLAEVADFNRFTLEHSTRVVGPVAYPWGFPLLLSPIYALFGFNLLALKMVSAFSYILYLLVLWFGFRDIHAPGWRLCLVGLFALNPALTILANNVSSDVVFLLISTLTIIVIRRVVIQGLSITTPLVDGILLGAGIAAAYFVRSNGVLLLLCLVLAQLVAGLRNKGVPELQRSRMVALAPFAMFLLLVVAWFQYFPDESASQVIALTDFSGARLAEQIDFYFNLPRRFFAGIPYRHFLHLAVFALAMAGMVRRVRTDFPIIVYMAATVALYVVWPGRQGIRYIVPILPFYISFALSALESLATHTPGREGWKRSWYIPVVLLIAWFAWSSAIRVRENVKLGFVNASGPFDASGKEMFEFISGRTNLDSVVVFFKPRLMSLMTGRKSFTAESLKDKPVGDYVCYCKYGYSQVSPRELANRVQAGSAQIVFDNGPYKIYRLTR